MRTIFVVLLSILMISCNQTAKQDKHNLPKVWETSGQKVFVFDPQLFKWAVYNEQGKMVKSGKASGGKDYCPDSKEACRTVTGTFEVENKQGADCKSSQFPIKKDQVSGGAKMPYCMHFHKGYAIHGAHQVMHKHVSHGCIHVPIEDAQWLNEQFVDIGTKIVVRPYA